MARGFKSGGRKVGTPNKSTGDTKEWIRLILADNRAEFEKRLQALSNADYVKNYLTLLSFVAPKMQAINVQQQVEEEKTRLIALLDTIPDEAVEAIAYRVKALTDGKEVV